MAIVVNEPTCMTTGIPYRKCTCPGHRAANRTANRKRLRRVISNDDGAPDYKALAQLLGVEADPATDPIAFLAELREALEGIQGQLGAYVPDAGAGDIALNDDDEDDDPFLGALEMEASPHQSRGRQAPVPLGTRPSTGKHIGKKIGNTGGLESFDLLAEREKWEAEERQAKQPKGQQAKAQPVGNQAEVDQLEASVEATIAERWGGHDGKVFYPGQEDGLESMDLFAMPWRQ
jgi:hypothetical protein